MINLTKEEIQRAVNLLQSARVITPIDDRVFEYDNGYIMIGGAFMHKDTLKEIQQENSIR